MKLLIIRHAIAEDSEEYKKNNANDFERPLTEGGKKDFKKSVKGLKKIVPKIKLLAYSPLLRTQQTAEILAKEYKLKNPQAVDFLQPRGNFKKIIPWLDDLNSKNDIVAIIGHKPDLIYLISWLITEKIDYFVEFKKGAVCLLEFPKTIKAGEAKLNWLLQPAQLQELS